LFEELKTIICDMLRFLATYYETEDKGTTIFTLGILTGVDVNIIESAVSDLIVEKRVYESNIHEFRIY